MSQSFHGNFDLAQVTGNISRLINLLEIHVVTQPVVFGLGLVLSAASRASARRVGLIPWSISPAPNTRSNQKHKPHQRGRRDESK